MTNLPGNKVLILFRMFTLASLVLLLTTCGTETSSPADNEKCGDIITWTAIVGGDFITSDYDYANHIMYLYYEDLTEPEDICTDEHVSVDFYVTTDGDSIIPGVTFKGKIYWGGLYEEEGDLAWSSDEYSLSITGVGLKQAFGDAPGWVGLQIIALVNSTGDLTADQNLIEDKTENMKIVFSYHKTK